MAPCAAPPYSSTRRRRTSSDMLVRVDPARRAVAHICGAPCKEGANVDDRQVPVLPRDQTKWYQGWALCVVRSRSRFCQIPLPPREQGEEHRGTDQQTRQDCPQLIPHVTSHDVDQPESRFCARVILSNNRNKPVPMANAFRKSTFHAADIGGSAGTMYQVMAREMRQGKPVLRKQALHRSLRSVSVPGSTYRVWAMNNPAKSCPADAPAAPPSVSLREYARHARLTTTYSHECQGPWSSRWDKTSRE